MTHLDDGADLRAVMDRSLRDLDVPDHCGPAAMASGRRIRTRRRVTVSLTGVAAVAAVAALTLPALGGSGSTSPQFGNDPTSAPVPSEGPGLPSEAPEISGLPSPGPDEWPSTEFDLPDGWWDMPSTLMAKELERALPGGVTVTRADTTTEGPDGPSPARGGLSGILTAEAGPGAFQLLLYPDIDAADLPDPVTTTDAAGNAHTTVYGAGEPSSSRLRCGPHYDTCLHIQDASGEVVGRLSSNMESGTLLYEVFLLGPDDGGLNFTVMNSTGEKPGYESPSADIPPLTLEQLRDLVQDPVWTSYQP